MRRFLSHRDSPDAGTGRYVDYAHLLLGLRDFQVIGKLLRGGIAHWDDRLYKLAEKFSALGFLVHGDSRLSVAHNIGQPQPT